MLQSTDGGSTVSSTEKRLKKLEEVSARRASRPFEMSWDTYPAPLQPSNNLPILR